MRDALGPLEGWRFWLANPHRAELLSLTQLRLWHPRMRAGCFGCAREHENPPAPGGWCGLYVLRDECRRTPGVPVGTLFSFTPLVIIVAGRARIWGRVIEHEQGWRAQYAAVSGLYPLWPPELDDAMRRLADHYGAAILEDLGPQGWLITERHRDVPAPS